MRLIDVSTEKNPEIFAQVDDADFDYLNRWKWYAVKRDNNFYARRGFRLDNGKTKGILMHRDIVAVPDGMQVDHRDGNGLNNQRANLRVCTPSQNQMNKKRPPFGSSVYKGVRLNQGKWEVRISKNNKRIYLGRFDTEIEAALTWNEAAKNHHGEFAYLNSIEPG